MALPSQRLKNKGCGANWAIIFNVFIYGLVSTLPHSYNHLSLVKNSAWLSRFISMRREYTLIGKYFCNNRRSLSVHIFLNDGNADRRNKENEIRGVYRMYRHSFFHAYEVSFGTPNGIVHKVAILKKYTNDYNTTILPCGPMRDSMLICRC